ncbi:basic leucine zipper transcriptional factor ATF-like 3 isoform X1 [Leopardus geoffroyi]|uniref:basic leucine zipper transcriptional factor ATF-like 3 isoform X1 n=1 Tax=Herpailurus yagouaroundi TaxID=1608482 RepID=UPI000C2FCAD5|nr:basic leucine zipper transcriptional factor ATF-like 3 isoform X1 [Puma yagouaroundi]XP_045308440.1 basic leucine zipper transcriptional factor ATF-like 3 isoform X1 [Leopardus geoffroyi]
MPPADRPWGARGSQGAQRDPAKPAVPPLGCASQSPEDDDRKVRRREKNRVAAQRSRKKQTQKADKLHEEYECLEQENTVLRREIGKLTAELQQLSEALKEHEKMCPLLLCPMNFVPVPRPDPVAGCLPR